MDLVLLYRINRSWEHPVLDWIMPVMSSFDVWLPLIAIAGCLILWRGTFKARAAIVILLLCVAVGDGMIANRLKKVTDRPRPHQAVYGLTVRSLASAEWEGVSVFAPRAEKPSRAARSYQEGRSFPSAHAVNVVAVSTAMCLMFGARWAWLFGIAAAVAYSRVYVASHWPSDIAASIAIGIAVGIGVPVACQFVWSRLAPRWLPQLHRRHPRLFGADPRESRRLCS